MSRKAEKKQLDRTPSWATARIKDAGASAFAWADEELSAAVDPDGKYQRISQRITAAVMIGAALLITVAGFQENLLTGLVSIGVLGIGLAASRAQSWPQLSFLTALPVVVTLNGDWSGAAAAVGIIALLTAAWFRLKGIALEAFGVSAGTALLIITHTQELVPLILLIAPLSVLARSGHFHRGTANSRIPFSSPGGHSSLSLFVRIFKGPKQGDIPPETQRKITGAEGERSTAVRLLGLQGHKRFGLTMRAKAVAFHDIASLDPARTLANIDHILLTEGGLFMLDSKVFAAKSTVVADPAAQDVVLRTPTGTRSLLPLIQSLAHEAAAAAAALNFEVSPVLVIHGAYVADAFSIQIPDGRIVEIIHQKDLITRFSHTGRPVLSRTEYASLDRALRAVPSAKGGPSTPVRPLPVIYRTQRKSLGTPPIAFAITPRPTETPATETAPTMPSPEAQWDAMERSVPAPLDLVEEGLRSLNRGTRFTVYTVDVDLQHYELRAMSQPCLEGGSLFVWATDLPNWEVHRATGRPVYLTRVPLDRILLAPGVGPE